jgi:hypothetical protein
MIQLIIKNLKKLIKYKTIWMTKKKSAIYVNDLDQYLWWKQMTR